MLFNSFGFAIFLAVVLVLYWSICRHSRHSQNILLLLASYFFYGFWDWRFLLLLAFSTLLDYFTGTKIFAAKTKSAQRYWFWLSISVNLGFLGLFKYFNFFTASLSALLMHAGIPVSIWSLHLILPVGISFYTFHGLSYIIDIYKNRIVPEKNLVNYALFVSFFPLLVAGPIERATHLLPQLQQKRQFDFSKAVDGLRQILWGLFKKIAIADTCAQYANMIFNDYSTYSASTLVCGAVFFAFQIYCDFSGYSDIAIGTARLFNIDLLRNFAFPYFSRDIAEFWRRWHISLSTWFRDYVYIPLGGSKGCTWIKIRNILVIFLLSGFWHGANWTFIAWGALNAIYFLPFMLLNRHRNNLTIVAHEKLLPSIKEVLQIGATFSITTFAWIFFRSVSVTDALAYSRKIFSVSIFTMPSLLPKRILPLISLLLIVEWLGREELYALGHLEKKIPRFVRWLFYYIIVIIIFYFAGTEQAFIYFQF